MKITTATVGSLSSAVIEIFLFGSILFGVWNAIAWQFNLPPFGWWTCVGIEALFVHWRRK